ncbi:MAG: hypothetical protein GY816_12455 [Cytophagales bacterium]|nr:hypothetical protein [Cytophagales bacterium]
MKQKTIWMRYLTIGISLTLLLLLGSCRAYPEVGILNVDFVFSNATDSSIEFDVSDDSKTWTLEIAPQSTSEVISIEAGSSNPQPEACCQDALGDLLGGQITLIVDNDLCFVIRDKGPHVISSYDYEIIGDHHFKYSYVFTDSDFEGDCE